MAPAYDLNPDPFGRGLSLNITEEDNALNVALAMEVARYFRLKPDRARKIVDYDCSSADGSAPHITYGFSKDKRPDLKQFMFSLLCVEGNIPLLGQVEDGNAVDSRLNNENLERVTRLIAENQIDRENSSTLPTASWSTRPTSNCSQAPHL
ncbi:MAG: hypothetical protein R3F19_30555 [Verrucomicrobiales bacterium]